MPKKKRCLIPKEWKEYWNKDFDDLTEEQRLKMVEEYMIILEDYERGAYTNRLKEPLFMTQQEKAEAWEKQKRKEGLEALIKEKEEKQKIEAAQTKEKEEKAERFHAFKSKWINDGVMILNLTERLRMENIQLRMDMLQIQADLLKEKIKNLDNDLDTVAEEVAKKYEIKLEDYDLDLLDGKFIRKKHVKFPYTFDDFPDDA